MFKTRLTLLSVLQKQKFPPSEEEFTSRMINKGEKHIYILLHTTAFTL